MLVALPALRLLPGFRQTATAGKASLACEPPARLVCGAAARAWLADRPGARWEQHITSRYARKRLLSIKVGAESAFAVSAGGSHIT
jgi:hypothetical protein